jgi:DNA-binding CsgD family transcriptional regulator
MHGMAEARPAPLDNWRDLIGALRSIVSFREAVIDTDAASGGWRVLLDADSPPPPEPPRQAGMAHMIDLLLRDQGATSLRIRLLRERGCPFTSEETALLARIGPLLRLLLGRLRGAAPNGALARHETRLAEALLAVFDQLGLGLCLVNAELRATLVSSRALGSGTMKLRRDSVGLADRAAEARLRGAVSAALATNDAPAQGINLGCAEHPAYALVTTLGRAPVASRPAPMAAVILLPKDPPRHAERVIQSLFGLSPVEARIAKLLGDGLTPAEAAQQMRMRPNTLRSYMKSIFVKLDVHRQSELVRLVSTTAGLLRGASAAPLAATDQTEEHLLVEYRAGAA